VKVKLEAPQILNHSPWTQLFRN